MIGSFAFTKGGTQTVTLSNGSTKAVSVLTVGASNVYAFVGTGGPYWTTSQGGTIQAPTSSTAVGVALSNLSFGLALLEGSDGSSYYALGATASGIALVGVPGVTLTATSLSLDVNGSGQGAGSPVVNFAASYPASGGNPAGLAVTTGPGTSIVLNDTAARLEATGTVTLVVGFSGIPAISLSATVTFEDTTDGNGTQVIELALENLGFSFGSPALFSISGASGLFVISGSTMAGEISVPLNFAVPAADNSTISFNGTISLEFNSGGNPVNTTFTDAATGMTQTLDVPAGPYVLLAGTGNLIIDGHTLSGSVQFDEVTVPPASGGTGQTEVRIAGSNIALNFTDPSFGGVTLSDGQGAFVFLSGGVAGQLSGNFQFSANGPNIGAGGQVYLQINTTNANVDQTIPLATGGVLQINVTASTFAIGVTNASINIDNIVTLTGNFQVTSEPGMDLIGASNVTLFLGEGPLTIDGAPNPNAIGIEVTNAEIGVVKMTSTGTYAVFAYGQAQLVGLSPLAVSGSIAVLINQTGQAINETVPLPPGSSPSSVPVVFQSAAFLEEFSAGYDSDGQVDPNQLLTISASQVASRSRASPVQFTRTPTGQVSVNVPTASVNITIPDSSGNFPSTPTFSIHGSAQFTIGGGSGFQLQSLRVDGFSIFGVGATIQTPSTSLQAPTATLSYPTDGQVIDVNQLNNQGYIEVHYNDVNNAGINVQNILNGSGQFILSGAAAANVEVNAVPTQLSPNDPSDFLYHFEGQFALPTGATTSTITVMFKPGSFADTDGATNGTQYASFTLFNSTTQAATQTITLSGNPTGGSYVLGVTRPDTGAAGTITVPFADTTAQVQTLFDAFFGAGNTTVALGNGGDTLTVTFTGTLAGQTVPAFTINSDGLTGGTSPGVVVAGNTAPATAMLAGPANGSTVNTQSMDQRAYIDVTFNLPAGETIVPGSLTGHEITISGAAVANVQLASGAPSLVSGNTYRYALAPTTGTAVNQMFAAGLVVVNFAATTLHVQVPQGAGSTTTVSTTINLLASTESFTVSGAVNDESSASNGITLGPLSLAGPSLGLAGESFSGGTLDLTIAIGVASASLSFGSSQSGSGVTASLTDVLGTFNVQVNLIKLIPAAPGQERLGHPGRVQRAGQLQPERRRPQHHRARSGDDHRQRHRDQLQPVVQPQCGAGRREAGGDARHGWPVPPEVPDGQFGHGEPARLRRLRRGPVGHVILRPARPPR